MVLRDLNKLCTPAQFYLFITLFSLVLMIYQNIGKNENILCVGNYECHNTPNKAVLLLGKVIYISFWTFVLQMICKGGYKNFAWFLVLLPIILAMLVLVFAVGPWTHRVVEGLTNLRSVKTPKDAASYVSKRVNDVADRISVARRNVKDSSNNKATMLYSEHREQLIKFANNIKSVSIAAAAEVASIGTPTTTSTVVIQKK